MKRLLTIALLLIALIIPTSAASTPAPANPAPGAVAAAPAGPILSETDQLKAKVLLQDLTIKQLQYANAQQSLQQIQTDFQKTQADFKVLVDELYKKAGLKQEEYDFNPQTLTFQKKAEQPAATSAPPKK